MVAVRKFAASAGAAFHIDGVSAFAVAVATAGREEHGARYHRLLDRPSQLEVGARSCHKDLEHPFRPGERSHSHAVHYRLLPQRQQWDIAAFLMQNPRYCLGSALAYWWMGRSWAFLAIGVYFHRR